MKVLSFFVSVSLTLLSLELGMALLDMNPPRPRTYVGEQQNRPSRRFIPDQDVGWRMRPLHSFQWTHDRMEITYTADDQGFRTDLIRRRSENPSKRIVILGDSFMWGTGVAYQKTVGHQLESSNDDYVVHNLAMPGFGVDQIWLSLRHWGLPLKPDLVIAGLHTGDFSRSFYAYRSGEGFNKPVYRRKGETLVKMTSEDRPGWVVRFLDHNSRLFRLGRRVDRGLGLNYGVGEWWSLNEAILDAMREESKRAGVPILFVHIPSENGPAFVSLEAYMREHNAHYLDFGAVPMEERKKLYLEDDGHFNAEGHKYLSNTILRWIKNNSPEHAQNEEAGEGTL